MLADNLSPKDKQNLDKYIAYENKQIEQELKEVEANNAKLERQAASLERDGDVMSAKAIREEVSESLKQFMESQTGMLTQFLTEMKEAKPKRQRPARSPRPKVAPAPTQEPDTIESKMSLLFS